MKIAALRTILAEEGLITKTAASPQASKIIGWAKEGGERVVINGKVVWAGIGNRSGLHEYARDLLREKWQKSGARLEKLVYSLPAGTKVELHEFQNINRDRGRWVKVETIIMPDPPASSMPPNLLRKAVETIELVDQITARVVSAQKYTGPDALYHGEVWEITLKNGRKIQWSASAPNEYGENGETFSI